MRMVRAIAPARAPVRRPAAPPPAADAPGSGAGEGPRVRSGPVPPVFAGDVIFVHGDCAAFIAHQLAERWPAEVPHAAQRLRALVAYLARGAALRPGGPAIGGRA